MRTIDEENSKNIELVAREEFLEHGFNGTSIRQIVGKLDLSTQTIYIRYGSKDGLFSHLVEDTAEEFLSLYEDLHDFDMTGISVLKHSADSTDIVFSYIYDHLEDFKLIFCKSSGSSYENYIDKLVEIEEQTMLSGFEKMGIDLDLVSEFFIHKKASEGIMDLYKIVEQDLSRDEARKYMDLVKKFRLAGWKEILNF